VGKVNLLRFYPQPRSWVGNTCIQAKFEANCMDTLIMVYEPSRCLSSTSLVHPIGVFFITTYVYFSLSHVTNFFIL